jgi:peptidoglycan-associated lipoprotein
MYRGNMKLLLTMFIISALGFSVGCARKGKPASAKFPGEETAAAQATTGQQAGEGELGTGLSSGFQEGDLALSQSDKGRELLFAKASGDIQTIYFDYDSSILNPEAKAALEKAAQWLRQNSTKSLRIEGNCDERGTTEYNLGLGERRALAARRYLISLGVDPERIFTISYGEEKPAIDGHDESTWRFNRRDDFGMSL